MIISPLVALGNPAPGPPDFDHLAGIGEGKARAGRRTAIRALAVRYSCLLVFVAMIIKRALVTAAGRDDERLPLQRLVDRDGTAKTALEIIVEEALAAGAHEIAIVVRPGEEDDYRAAAGTGPSRLEIIPQPEPKGYGHAILSAADFLADEPFLHLVGDHLPVSDAGPDEAGAQRCAEQLVAVAKAEGCSVSAVQATR